MQVFWRKRKSFWFNAIFDQSLTGEYADTHLIKEIPVAKSLLYSYKLFEPCQTVNHSSKDEISNEFNDEIGEEHDDNAEIDVDLSDTYTTDLEDSITTEEEEECKSVAVTVGAIESDVHAFAESSSTSVSRVLKNGESRIPRNFSEHKVLTK